MNTDTQAPTTTVQKRSSWLVGYMYFSLLIASFFVALTIMGVYLEHYETGMRLFLRGLDFSLQMFLWVMAIMWLPVILFLGIREFYRTIRK